MPVREITSAEALVRYAVGRKVAGSMGRAWRDVQLSVLSLPPAADVFTMPAVTEPFVVWTTSGEAETQERARKQRAVADQPGEKGFAVPHRGGCPL